MKKITFYDLFLIFAILCFWGNKNVYSSIILLCAGTVSYTHLQQMNHERIPDPTADQAIAKADRQRRLEEKHGIRIGAVSYTHLLAVGEPLAI